MKTQYKELFIIALTCVAIAMSGCRVKSQEIRASYAEICKGARMEKTVFAVAVNGEAEERKDTPAMLLNPSPTISPDLNKENAVTYNEEASSISDSFERSVGTILKEQAIDSKAQQIDIVLILDVSSSMNTLIDAARERLVNIVEKTKKIKTMPRVRVALISYGCDAYDAASGWVRIESDITENIDDVKAKLMSLSPSGGEEYVARALYYSFYYLSWNKDPGTLRTIFIAGNEVVDQDPDISPAQVCQEARSQGIIVNTIFCGDPSDSDSQGWIEIAQSCSGKAAFLDTSGENNALPVAIVAPSAANTPNEKPDFVGRVSGTFNNTLIVEYNGSFVIEKMVISTSPATKYMPKSWKPKAGDNVRIFVEPSRAEMARRIERD